MENRFNINTAFLPDDEADRIYSRYPYIGQDSETYCPTCEKEGTYVWKGETCQCNCHEQLQLYKHYLAAGIGVPYQRLDWADYEGEEDPLDKLGDYIQNYRRYLNRGVGLFFWGLGKGTGKTMLTTLTLKEFVKRGVSCFSTTSSNMVAMFTAGWRSDEDRLHFQKKFVNSQVLLLDDVGRELRTKNNLAETTFDSILRTRVQEGRTTFITTNFTPQEIENGYGSAALSLLKEVSIHYEFSGEDFRSKSQQRTVNEVKSGVTRPIV